MVTKEEKRQRKVRKQEQAKRRDRMSSMLFRGGAVVVTVLAIYVFYQGIFGGLPVVPPDRVAAHDQVRGDPDAPLTMTVYADFQCPSCASEMQVIARGWSRISDEVQLVFRHFPLDTHRHAFLAARYAEAAGRQGSFWEMHDQLFNNQAVWSGLAGSAARERFDAYAEAIGLDMAQLQEDLGDNAIRDKIVADQQSGIRAGVRATPTTFVNGRQVTSPRSVGALLDLVRSEAPTE